VIELYWIPLGAGGHFVRCNGRAYEALAAGLARRPRRALYHAALIVDGRAIEVGPARGAGDGPVGARWAGRWRIFRYEIRCGATIPDLGEAVDSPLRFAGDGARLFALLPEVPRPVWGRDELRAGEMWTSNSVIAWLLARAGIDAAAIRAPAGGRAPGWDAGLVVARRSSRPRADREAASAGPRSARAGPPGTAAG
jgi:hypothetical protein